MKALERFIGAPLDGARRLGWFGFSADPPTLAHRAVVDAVLGSGRVDKVIVFPAAEVDYKRFQATDWQRMEMTEIWREAAGYGDEVILSRFDLIRDKAYYWADLARDILQMAPKMQHYFVVGSNDYQQIASHWHKGKELLEIADFLVVPREGTEAVQLHEGDILLSCPPIAGSSTDVRAGNLSGVDEKVRRTILEQQLYQ